MKQCSILRPWAWLCVAGFTVLLAACDMGFKEFNPAPPAPTDFLGAANKLAFGTSSGPLATNWVTNNGDGTVDMGAYDETTYAAGKIAGSEDGITYYFKEVMATQNFKISASVTILAFGGIDPITGVTTSNGQEGFGLMARDFVPQYPGLTMADLVGAAAYDAGESGGSSNMAMVGGIKRGIRAAVRRGVTGSTDSITVPSATPDASMSRINWFPLELGDYSLYPTLEDRPDFPKKNAVYGLILEKNNSGFRMTIIPPADKGIRQEYFFAEPDILFNIAKDRYYVGLFAARSAKVKFSNIEYWEYAATNDAPKVDPTPEIVAPAVSVLSPTTDSTGTFKLRLSANVAGRISVYQDGKEVPGAMSFAGQWITETLNGSVVPYSLYDVPVYPLVPGENTFKVVFYPNPSSLISTDAAITTIHKVTLRSYGGGGDIYASPTGSPSNTGTISSPLDVQTAINYVQPGQTIVMQNGTYDLTSLTIPRYNSGNFGKPKTLKAATRDQVIVNFNKDLKSKGAVFMGDYWVIDGISIRSTPDKVKGCVLMGNYNILRWVKTFDNGDTGLQISGRSNEPKAMWPKGNLIEYCESYDNRDAAEADADGFAAKLTVGGFNADDHNKFSWCVSHNNTDDGWDLFTKKETGEIGVVILENCIAYQNGMLMSGYKTSSGRNGFKMGGEGLSVAHQAINCLSFNNGAHGFTCNSNPAVVWTNCTSFDNGGPFWNTKAGADSRNFTIYSGANEVRSLAAVVTNLLSLYSDPDGDGIVGDDPAVTNRKEDKVQLSAPSQGYLYTSNAQAFTPGATFLGSGAGVGTKNYNQTTKSVADVASTVAPLYDADLTTLSTTGRGFLKRYPSGKFVLGTFMKPVGFTSGSDFSNYSN